MAISERAAQAIDESGAVDNPQFSLRVEVSAETSASPDRVLIAACDFSERRARIWGNVTVKHLELHERGETWAEVTEGTMVLGLFWERCRYDWSQPEIVVATVLDSNVLRPGSIFELRATARDGGGSAVEMILARNFNHGVKGTIARCINHLGGRRLFGFYLRVTLAAIEKMCVDGERATRPTR
jgi:hypothetical protein